MIITGLRLIAQTAEHPDRASRNLFIFSTTMLSLVGLLVLATWTFSFMKLRARRVVMRLPLAREGAVFVGRVDLTFLHALTPYSTNGEPVSGFLGNPIMVVSAAGISVWKGVVDPFQVAVIPHGSLGQTRLLVQRRRFGAKGYQLETALLGENAGQRLTWRVQSLGPIGLQPAGKSRHEEAIQALERLRPPD